MFLLLTVPLNNIGMFSRDFCLLFSWVCGSPIEKKRNRPDGMKTRTQKTKAHCVERLARKWLGEWR
jgi:hypothetical protein